MTGGAAVWILSAAGIPLVAVLLFLALEWWLLDCPRPVRHGITAAIFTAGFILGVDGFARLGAGLRSEATLQNIANAVHSTLQLSVLSLDAAATPGWRLGLARVLMPLATAQLILATLLTRARQALLRARLLVKLPDSPDVIVLGSGDTAFRIACLYEHLLRPTGARGAASAERAPAKILGVDSSLTTPSASAFQDRFWLLQAALESEDIVASLRLSRRRGVVIGSGDERTDIALLARAFAPANARSPASPAARAPAVVVGIDSDVLPRACQFDPRLSDAYARGAIQFIHPARLDARQLFRDHAPHALSPERFRAGRRNQCHVVLFATAPSVDAFVAQAVRALVYDPNEPLRITLLVEEADATSRRLWARFPALSQASDAWPAALYREQLPLARLRLFESRPERIDAHAVHREHAAQPVDVIYVLGRDDTETCLMASEAFKVAATLPAPGPAVVVGLHDLRASERLAEAPLAVERRFFRLGTWAASDAATSELAALLPDTSARSGGADEAAERLWREYGPDPNAPTWQRTAHHVKWWNRFAADHARVKLALLGLSPSAKEEDIRRALAAPPALDWLTRLEHRRYVCERLIDGWLAVDGTKANQYLLNPTLVAFHALPAHEKAKDQRIVADLVHTLET